MKHFLILTMLALILVPVAMAQTPDYDRWEFFGGYSTMSFDNLGGNTTVPELNEFFDDKNNLRGLNVSITRNIHKYVGIKFDYSLHLREDNFTRPLGSGTIDSTVQNYLGGLQFKDNTNVPRFKPFAHALFGVATQKEDIDSPQLQPLFGIDDFHANETSFAMAFGGGLDIRLGRRVDVRAVQADWNIINRGDQIVGHTTVPRPGFPVGSPVVFPGMTQNNLRLSFGIVVH